MSPAERTRAACRDVTYVCHKIKNSLVVIGGYARHILRSEQLDEKNREKLHVIVDEIERLETFLSDVTRAAKKHENEP